MQQLDDKLKRATANAVYWMKRYYNMRVLIDGIVHDLTIGDAYKTILVRDLISAEKRQDVLNDPNGSKQETNAEERG